MNSLNDILSMSADFNYDDWMLSALLMSFILMCLVIGLNKSEFKKSIKSLLKFNGKDEDIVYSSLGTTDSLLMMIQVSFAVGSSQYILLGKTIKDNPDTLKVVMASFLIVFLIIFFKVNLCNFVNHFLYNRRLMPTPPSLWTGFYILSIFTFGSFLSLISILFFLFNLPIGIGRVLLITCAIIVEISVIIKTYRVFFRKKIGLLIFFIYLCALEFAPTFLAWLLIG
jgi:hypothetical protein